MSPLNFACGSGIFAALFSLVYLTVSKKIKEVKRLDKKNFGYILIVSIAIGIFYQLALFFGQSLTTATNTGFLLRIAPLFALLYGHLFLREMISRKQILIMLVMLFGLFLLATGGKLIVIDTGSLLVLFAGALIGFDHAFSRKIMKRGIAPDVLTSLRMVIGGLFFYLFVIIYSSFSFVSDWEIYLLSGTFIFLAVFARNLGLKKLKASIVSAILLLSPVFTAILGIGLLGEKISYPQLLGGFVILVGGCLLAKVR